jgi:hypothetical protein
MLLVLSAVALNAVIASFSFSASITIDSAIYEVNNQGDLTIQLTGTKTAVSVADANFSIQIPDAFEMETLTDGTPVIEILSNGTALEKAEDGSNFQVVFRLRTLKTTLLPKEFSFKMDSISLRYSGFISPQWAPNPEEQSAGGGAAVAASGPYITSFHAYDSEKGQTEHVKTYVRNPGYRYEYLEALRYQLKANDYSNWQDYTPYYTAGVGIPGGYSVVVHDYLAPTFISFSGERYALNRGSYHVTEVYALGGRWYDDYSPNKQFNVNNPASGTHVVFVLHLVDQNFRNYHNEDTWFDVQEGHDFRMYDIWFGRWTDLNTEFDIDLVSLVYSWSPGTTNLYQLFHNKIRQSAFESPGIWQREIGTDKDNHGFDMLFGHVYLGNTYPGSDEDYQGAGILTIANTFPLLITLCTRVCQIG